MEGSLTATDMNDIVLALALIFFGATFILFGAFAAIYGNAILETFTAAKAAMKRWVSTPKPSMIRNEQEASPLFAKLPLEIRLMIYRYVLVSGGCLTCVGDAVKRKHCEAMKKKKHDMGRTQPYGLDARLLRSCRRTYEEALPVLYRENHFVFTNLLGLGVFQKGGLVTSKAPNKQDPNIPEFAFEAAPHGRLTYIRTLSLVFAASVDGAFEWQISSARRAPYRSDASTMLTPSRIMTGPRGAPNQFQYVFDRARDWGLSATTAREEWRSVLGFNDVWYSGVYAMKLRSSIRFPELDYLMLDFGQLGLGSGVEDGVDVSGLIDLIGCERKLRYLAVSGLRHDGTVEALKKGFLTKGGKFVDLDSEEEGTET